MPDLGEDDEAIGTDSFESYDGKNRTADCIDGADEGHQSQHCSANYFRGQSMKNFFCFILALAAASTPALAITVQPLRMGTGYVPFSLTASTSVCDSKPAVSMGYSLDHGGQQSSQQFSPCR